MHRFDFFYRQYVNEEELDAAFSAVENAIGQFVAAFDFVGIAKGGQLAEAAPTPNMTVQVQGPCTIYDQANQRIYFGATQSQNMALDEFGASTAVVAPGNERWLSVFAKFKRVLSDERLDGFGETIYFDQAESFELKTALGVEAASGTAVRPNLRSDEILLGDVLRVFGKNTIESGDIDVTRAELIYDLSGSPLDIQERSLHDVLQAMLDAVNTNPVNLANQDAPNDGVTLVGIDAITGTNYSSPQGTLKTMLVDLLGALDENSSTPDGASRLGFAAYTTAPWNIPATTVRQAITGALGMLASVPPTSPYGAEHIGMQSSGVGNFNISAGDLGGWLGDLLAELAASTSSDDGAKRVGSEARSTGSFSLSASNVSSQLDQLLTQLAAAAATSGAERIGCETLGWLTGSTVRGQLNLLQSSVARLLASNDVYDTGFYGPLFETKATADRFFCLWQWGDPGTPAAQGGLYANVDLGGFAIVQGLYSDGTDFFIGNGAQGATAFLMPKPASGTVAAQWKRWNGGAHSTDENVGDIFEASPAADAGTNLMFPPTSEASGNAISIDQGGIGYNAASQEVHWHVGMNASGAGEFPAEPTINFPVRYATAPTSFTINTTASTMTGTAAVVDATRFGCSLNGLTSGGAGRNRAYGTIDVSP